jgi:hypothetical protein
MSSEIQNVSPEPEGDEGAKADSEVRDPMAPPAVPCECFCLHCRRIFMSDQMWFQRVRGARDGFSGFWMCPTPNCSGAGFEFDIFPTNPEDCSEGVEFFDTDEEEEGEWEEEFDDEAEAEWDPDESRYAMMDEMSGADDEEDLEGEEWKYGLEPGQTPEVLPPPPGVEPRNWREEEALYDAPDRRPRERDWSEQDDVPRTSGTPFTDEDIPF